MRRVFITGASSGLGQALARAYAAQGAVLGLVARRGDLLQQLCDSLPQPQRHRVYALDVTDHAALAAAAADFIAAEGGADVVIANAGISQGTLTDYAEDLPVFERIIATNVTATVWRGSWSAAGSASSLSGMLAGRGVKSTLPIIARARHWPPGSWSSESGHAW